MFETRQEYCNVRKDIIGMPGVIKMEQPEVIVVPREDIIESVVVLHYRLFEKGRLEDADATIYHRGMSGIYWIRRLRKKDGTFEALSLSEYGISAYHSVCYTAASRKVTHVGGTECLLLSKEIKFYLARCRMIESIHKAFQAYEGTNFGKVNVHESVSGDVAQLIFDYILRSKQSASDEAIIHSNSKEYKVHALIDNVSTQAKQISFFMTESVDDTSLLCGLLGDSWGFHEKVPKSKHNIVSGGLSNSLVFKVTMQIMLDCCIRKIVMCHLMFNR
jgi:hypothetical protein